MTPALERAIAAGGRPALRELGCSELASALAQALGGDQGAALVGEEQLKARVFRLRFEAGGAEKSFVAKRMSPEHARRNELAIRRWLPDLGLAALAPGLLGVAAGPDGRWVWHAYEDLGAFELDTRDPDLSRVAAAVRRIAALHVASARHPLLAECRLHGENRDPGHLATTVRDAMRALEALRPPRLTPTAGEQALRERLLARLARLLDEAPRRARELEEWGGPETLLHGDLWATNTFVEPVGDGFRVRLVDWDRMGVGRSSYDLSTFLLRFAPGHRAAIVACYREAVGRAGWHLPDRHQLNRLFETAEWARYANRLIWPALALHRDRAAWGFDELAAVESWFQAFEPVLPEADA